MRLSRVVLIAVLVCSLAGILAPPAAAACPLAPAPVWVDYAGFGVHGYPVQSILARPNVALATGTERWMQDYRAAGADTVGWHMQLRNIAGSPSRPASRRSVLRKVPGLVQLARQMSSCDPWLALNEMQAVQLPEPLTRSQLRYRDNVLVLARQLQAAGVRTYVLLPRIPLSKTRYRRYWRALSWQAHLVYEAYSFDSLRAVRLGPTGGRRYLVNLWRDSMRRLLAVSARPNRLGLMIPYWSKHPRSGRRGLADAGWFNLTRTKTLAAGDVARGLGLGTLWSWGWLTNPATGERDADKPKAACVYLNTRDASLCDPSTM